VHLYLEFPPETRYVSHAPLSWAAFAGYGLFILAAAGPLFIRGLKAAGRPGPGKSKARAFPLWGWVGIGTGLTAWTLAWTRFPWFDGLQAHTFTPLWLSYIVLVNGLTYRRRGHCMMTDRPGFFLLLFPVSALFWWFFEYLNRFVQNWYYVGVHFGPWEYFCYATMSFSTVLPAVLGTRDWLLGFSWVQTGFGGFTPLRFSRPKPLAWFVLLASGAGLAGIGIWPNYLFPLLWMSPLLIFVSLQALMGENHVLSKVAQGDWRLIASSALAALLCGWFWEMWNYYSLAKWEYSVPFVHAYQVFEMPLLGYAGYLPFGLECAVIAMMMEGYGVSDHVFGKARRSSPE
jgi:hypothetical protein